MVAARSVATLPWPFSDEMSCVIVCMGLASGLRKGVSNAVERTGGFNLRLFVYYHCLMRQVQSHEPILRRRVGCLFVSAIAAMPQAILIRWQRGGPSRLVERRGAVRCIQGRMIQERRDVPDVSKAMVLQAVPGVNFTVFAIGKSDFVPFSTRADLAFC